MIVLQREQVSAVPLIPERVTTRLWLIVTIDEPVIELGLLFGFYRKRKGSLAISRAENAHARTFNCGFSPFILLKNAADIQFRVVLGMEKWIGLDGDCTVYKSGQF